MERRKNGNKAIQDKMKKSNICIIRSQNERKERAQAVSEGIMIENFPNMTEDIKSQFQKA